MTQKNNVFVVVDPSDDHHVAFERAVLVAAFEELKLTIFVAVDFDSVDTRASNDNLFRDQHWFNEAIRNTLEEANIEYSVQVCWSSEWQEAILQEAKRSSADLIYLPVHRKSTNTRFTFAESKWGILKNAHCPVVLIRPGAVTTRKVVLAAVNFQTSRSKQKQLNDNILAVGQQIAENYGAEFHVTNAYRESINYPDRGKLANTTGLPANRIHVVQGYTSDAISEVVSKIGADILIMGSLGQNGRKSTLRRGNTAERVIGAVDTDVVVLNV